MLSLRMYFHLGPFKYYVLKKVGGWGQIWQFWKTQFFGVGRFDFFFSKKQKNCFIPMKIDHKLFVWMDGTHFLFNDGLQPKVSMSVLTCLISLKMKKNIRILVSHIFWGWNKNENTIWDLGTFIFGINKARIDFYFGLLFPNLFLCLVNLHWRPDFQIWFYFLSKVLWSLDWF